MGAPGGLERVDVERALTNKGFVVDTTKSRDHNYFFLHVDGRRTGVYTKTSHGTSYKTIGGTLVTAMAKQVGLTSKAFREFVDCTLTHADHLAALRARGVRV